MKPLDHRALLAVRSWQDPIAGKPSVTCFAPGLTVAEMAARVPLQSEAFRPLLEARINGDLIYQEHWHRVRPKPDSPDRPIFLTFHVALLGGGGGANGQSRGGKILSSVAAIALIGVSLFAGPIAGALGLGKFGAALIGGAAAIGGSLLMQGLAAPAKAAGGSGTSGAQFGTASATNDFSPGDYLQRIIGACKAAPQVVVPPFTEMDNGVLKADTTKGYRYDQYVTTVLALAGEHQIDAVYIGDVDAADMKDVEVEIRNGTDADAPLTLVSDTRIEEQVGVQLSEWDVDPDDTDAGFVALDGEITETEPVFHRVETKKDPDAFRFEFVLPNGLWRINDAQGEAAGVALRVRMRRRIEGGWTTWTRLPELAIRAYEMNTPIRMQLLVKWVDALPASSSADAWPPTKKALTKVRGWAQVRSNSSWSSSLLTPAGTDRYAEWKYESESRIILHLLKATYPPGRYQFEVMRSFSMAWSALSSREDRFGPIESGGVYGLPDNPAKFHDDIVLASVQSIWNEYPIEDGGNPVTLVAIRARNRQLDQITVRGAGVIEDWDGSAWVAGQTPDNPAAWYRHVLKGIHNARPVPDALIDEEALQDWHRWCRINGKRISAVIKGRSVMETLQLIALCGWGSPVFGALHSVTIDRLQRRGAVGVITQRNAGGFSFEKPFSEIPHGLRVTYNDEDYDYEPREIIVYAPGYNSDGSSGLAEATKFQAISYEGLPTETLAMARAQHDLNWMLYRNRIVTCIQDIEHLEHRRGDLVLVETDILGQVGGRGRVKEVLTSGGLVTGLLLDEERDYTRADADGADRGVAIRLADGTVRVEKVTSADADLAAISFDAAFVMPVSGSDDLIVPGCLVATGTLGSEARPMIIRDIAPGPDLTAQLAMVDYASLGMYGTGYSTLTGRAFSNGFSGGFG